jgi:hypothetical protein
MHIGPFFDLLINVLAISLITAAIGFRLQKRARSKAK